jgi:hypothetical protein
VLPLTEPEIRLRRYAITRRARAAGRSPRRGLAALRGLRLDSACALAVTWQPQGSETKRDQLNSKVHAFSGNPAYARDHPAALVELGALYCSLAKLIGDQE